jgi:hypothetical protein
MLDPIRQSIEKLTKQLEEQEAQVAKTKSAINVLCEALGEQPRFSEVLSESRKVLRIRPDAFYSKAFATAVREVLQMRNEPLSVSDIVDILKQGGFDFGKTKDLERAVSISLGKNTAAFLQLPNSDTFGLVEWYPDAKRSVENKKPKMKKTVGRKQKPVGQKPSGKSTDPKTEKDQEKK